MAETASTGGGELGTRGGAGADRLRPQRYDTVRAALRYRADGAKKRKIRERIVRTEAGRRAFDISPWEAAERLKCPIDHPEPDGPFGWRSRAWHADEYRWRLEADRPDGGVNILASDGWTKSNAPPFGPQYMGRIWTHRVGGARAKMSRGGSTWPTTTTGPSTSCLRTKSAASPPSCAPWTSRLRGRWSGRGARRCA